MSDNRRSPYWLWVSIVAVIAAIIAVIMWFKPEQNATESAVDASTTLNSSRQSISDKSDPYKGLENSSRNTQAKFVTGLEGLPRSLQGTEVDGEVIIDENKQLVVTQGLRRLFDYFLSAVGEEEETIIRARIETYIRSFVPEPAASQALVIFDKYVAYLKALPEIEKRYGNLQLQATQSGQLDLNMIAQQKQDIARLRQQYFDKETIEAFFGAEDEYDAYSLEMVNIEQNKQLSAEQKEAARNSYISRMPNNLIKQNLEQQAGFNDLLTRTEQMKKNGATAEELYSMRRDLVGAPAAARLAQVDKQDDDFDRRFDQYENQKKQLLSQGSSNEQAQAQLNQLEQQLFSETERKRLSGYGALQEQK